MSTCFDYDAGNCDLHNEALPRRCPQLGSHDRCARTSVVARPVHAPEAARAAVARQRGGR